MIALVQIKTSSVQTLLLQIFTFKNLWIQKKLLAGYFESTSSSLMERQSFYHMLNAAFIFMSHLFFNRLNKPKLNQCCTKNEVFHYGFL